MKNVSIILFILLFGATSNAQTAKDLYIKAKNLAQSTKYKEAIVQLTNSKKLLIRTNPKIESLLMQAYYNNGDMVNAKIAYETLLKVTPPKKQNSELFKSYKEIGLLIDDALNEQEKEYQQDIVDRQKEAEDIAINNDKKQRQKDIDKQDVLKTKNKKLEKKLFLVAKQSSDLSALQAYKDNFPSSNFSQETQELIDILNVKEDLTSFENREPTFIGGGENFYKWLSYYLVYPEKARQMGVEGLVAVAFTVSKDGDISDIEILSGSNFLKGEVIRLMNMSPKWTPAIKNGEFIEERTKIGIHFKLE